LNSSSVVEDRQSTKDCQLENIIFYANSTTYYYAIFHSDVAAPYFLRYITPTSDYLRVNNHQKGEQMKSLICIAMLTLSSPLFAKTTATEAFNALLPSGEYEGRNSAGKCFVNVLTRKDSVTVSIKTASAYDVLAVLDSSSSYAVNAATGEISATQSANYPRYYNGGSKYLYVKSFDTDEVDFSISTILLDHRGEDASTYLDCKISL